MPKSSKAKSQLLKGILEGCILAVIYQKEVYGYELSLRLQEEGFQFVSEGSIYPILLRLQKDNVIEGAMRISPSGPNRKYYHLTAKGYDALNQFKQNWLDMKVPVENLLDKVK
ncbi:PadR family transcriptional regulator [Terrilactibacillus laevilacticus]|uniref:PadR family transcriptional regulator n=1 Tax=Terrilactibacillus laevilacticus TaxID=1380157 RepID=A0ABW5PQC3_9BACI|nr:PadR family transcriptional regulator [Terrilactibacillus laevilacticus]